MILIKRQFILITLSLLIVFSACLIVNAADSVISWLPETQRYQISIITPQGEAEYVYDVLFEIDPENGQATVTTTGSGYTMESRYDADLRLHYSEMQVVNQHDAGRVGFDRRSAVYDPEENRIILAFYLNERLQDTREIYLHDEGTEIEVLGLYLQSLLLQNRTDFHGKLVDLNGSGRYQLDSRVLTAKQVRDLTKKKNTAPQVQQLLQDPEQVTVFSIGYDGILRWFFPTRFHVVLESEAPHRILAFWAGSGDRLRYHLYDYQE